MPTSSQFSVQITPTWSPTDLNADGKIDLAYLNNTFGTVTVQLNTSTGPGQLSFSPQELSISGDTFGPISPFDADGDGGRIL
jgi:hypothetical protein